MEHGAILTSFHFVNPRAFRNYINKFMILGGRRSRGGWQVQEKRAAKRISNLLTNLAESTARRGPYQYNNNNGTRASQQQIQGSGYGLNFYGAQYFPYHPYQMQFGAANTFNLPIQNNQSGQPNMNGGQLVPPNLLDQVNHHNQIADNQLGVANQQLAQNINIIPQVQENPEVDQQVNHQQNLEANPVVDIINQAENQVNLPAVGGDLNLVPENQNEEAGVVAIVQGINADANV